MCLHVGVSVQGTSVCQGTAIGATVILLYASRACYNLVVLALSSNTINSFDYDWYNVSDQVRPASEHDKRVLKGCISDVG